MLALVRPFERERERVMVNEEIESERTIIMRFFQVDIFLSTSLVYIYYLMREGLLFFF